MTPVDRLMPELPPIPEELLRALQKRFPIRVPDKDASDREIWIEVGKQEFLQFLLHQYDQQNLNVIKEQNVLR